MGMRTFGIRTLLRNAPLNRLDERFAKDPSLYADKCRGRNQIELCNCAIAASSVSTAGRLEGERNRLVVWTGKRPIARFLLLLRQPGNQYPAQDAYSKYGV